MRALIIIIVGLVAFIGSCKPEPETYLNTKFINNTLVPIKITNYYGDNQTNIINASLQPDEEISSSSHQWGGGDRFPVELFHFHGDSFVVYFVDTLRIVHLSQLLSLDSTLFQGRDNVILYSDSRNLNNLDSYIKEKPTDNGYEAKYIFTVEDLEYAFSVYE